MRYTLKRFLIDRKILRIMKEMRKRGIDFKDDLMDHMGELYEVGYDYMADYMEHGFKSFKEAIEYAMLMSSVNKYERFFEKLGYKRSDILGMLIDYYTQN